MFTISIMKNYKGYAEIFKKNKEVFRLATLSHKLKYCLKVATVPTAVESNYKYEKGKMFCP